MAATVLGALGKVSSWAAEKAEYARIARYYATQSMLVLDPVTGEYSESATPEAGVETLREHYARTLVGGSQGLCRILRRKDTRAGV